MIWRKILRIVFVLVGLAVIAGASFAGGFVTGQRNIVTPEAETIVITPEEAGKFLPFFEALAYLKRDFYGQVPTLEELLEGAVEGMFEVLPPEFAEFTYYFNAVEAEVEAGMMRGDFGGVGVRLTETNGELIIASIIPDTPAEEAGLKPGDVIIAVDGVEVTGISWNERHRAFRGKAGTDVTVLVGRTVVTETETGEKSEFKELEFTITRKVISTPSVNTRLFADGKIGYLSLAIFDQKSADEVRQALQQLINEDRVEGIVFDLRGNPGGNRSETITIISQFIPGLKPAALILSKGGEKEVILTERGGLATDIPLVVLVDEGSASGSEMFTAAIKDYERGVIIGTPTRGKGVGQTPRRLKPSPEGVRDEGPMIMIVDHEFRSPVKGTVIHGVGVQPDIYMLTTPAQRARGVDPALDRAIATLLEEIAGR